MVSNPVWLKSIRRAADSNLRTSIRKASVMTTRPEGILRNVLFEYFQFIHLILNPLTPIESLLLVNTYKFLMFYSNLSKTHWIPIDMIV